MSAGRCGSSFRDANAADETVLIGSMATEATGGLNGDEDKLRFVVTAAECERLDDDL